MTFTQLSLWDLLPLRRRPRPSRPRRDAQSPKAPPRQTAMRHRYDQLVVEMKERYNLRIRKWRSSTTGCAWEVHYHDGTVSRLIETPYPTGPVSCAVFLHEVGHHAIGLGRYRPRCLEEYHAWMWSLQAMREHGFNVTSSVEKRVHESLRYAVGKATRRGLKRLPVELAPYMQAQSPKQGPGDLDAVAAPSRV